MSKINSRNSIPSKAEQGQSLVELAISLIVMLTLLAGAVDFGVALYSFVSLRDAAQEGALYASVYPTDLTEIEARVRTASSTPVDLSDTSAVLIDIKELPSGATRCEGNGAMIQVEVSYDYQLTMPLLPGILGISEIPLSASVIDAILRPACDS